MHQFMYLSIQEFLTIYLLQWDLAKDMQVGTVQNSAEHPIQTWVVGVEQGLGGHTICYEPNTQEEEEKNTSFICGWRKQNIRLLLFFSAMKYSVRPKNVSEVHHSLQNDILWS